MNFEQWNSSLEEAFLREGPNRPVYFSATEAELQHMNDRLGLGMGNPVDDLRAAIRPYSFLTFGTKHRRWVGARSTDPPPWLPFLAATTVVVDQQSEQGSTAFYTPLSRFLGHPERVTQHEYEETFYRWWPALKRWLEDDDRHAGRRGFATWGSIPEVGPRSVIGHPYTQVLLRREERRQVDDFLAEFDHLDSEPPTARDRLAVAQHLIDALRRWVRDRHCISARLRRILEAADSAEALSLGYVLLDRLFDEFSGHQREESSARVIRMVPAYDDYQRLLRVVAIAPNWVRPAQPVFVPGADDALRAPGDVAAIDAPITAELLRSGLEIGPGPIARLAPCRRYVMAAREWALWCSVEGALPGEELHILLPADEAARCGLRSITCVRGLPAGWAISGPVELHQLPATLAESFTVTSRQLVPRLRGGLRLQSRTYLHGGPPGLELARFEGDITIDGKIHSPQEGSLSLSALDLEVGEHRVTVGGFDLTFQTVQSLQSVDSRPTLGRDRSGAVVPLDQASDLVTGARIFPADLPLSHRNLIPRVDRLVKLGAPGEIGVLDGPLVAPWARALGLPHVGVEVHARSTYPDGDRLVKVPQWIAWPASGDRWVIAECHQGPVERDEAAVFIPRRWRHICAQIGASPTVWTTGGIAQDGACVLQRWRTYCEATIEE